MCELINQISNGLYKGFIDKFYPYGDQFKPQLLVNDRRRKMDVLSSIIEELRNSQSFMFSVAFITESGLATLKSHLLDLHMQGIKGRIITSTYQYFNKPKIFQELLKLKNVEIRIAETEGFHSKGYIFDHGLHTSLIVGSSNLTANALKVNYEWNVKLTSLDNGDLVDHFHSQFEEMWQVAKPLTQIWIAQYKNDYEAKQLPVVAEHPGIYQVNRLADALTIKPNKMQVAALSGIASIRDSGESRGLVVSATGTGKTYLSAFDVRSVSPKRLLFIAHREQILKKAKIDFQRVLGGLEEDFGILSGNIKDVDAKYLFATVQTISKWSTLEQFAETTFDYIIIDESHRAGAKTYQRIIDYFKPEFLLGMTATPERTDGYDLFKLFHYNIAYEIRLQEALEEEMLAPFHYYGVTDLEIDGEVYDTENFSRLISDERVRHILEKIDYYGHSGEETCGLIFCSTKQESHILSEKLNNYGLRTVALTGDDNQEMRIDQVTKLESGELDYILTVDIFNEGIDIPKINQVVMLRQTESSIIFVQQLGRGLRKHDQKSFLTVIDFIGNHENNYLIPIALYGDQTYNKDRLRKHLVARSQSIPGTSTVNFEQIAEEKIYQAIDQKNMSLKRDLDDDYQLLKNRLGHQPMMMDFIKHNMRDPMLYVEYSKSYFNYVTKKEKIIDPPMSINGQKTLEIVGLHLANGVRPEEPHLLKSLIGQKEVKLKDINQALVDRYQVKPLEGKKLKSVLRNVNLLFMKENYQRKQVSLQERYQIKLINYDEKRKVFSRSDNFSQLVREPVFINYLTDQLEYSESVYLSKMEQSQQIDGLLLYQKYTRKDVFRILGWDENPIAQNVGGYLISNDKKFCPIFVNYHKEDNISETTKYEDTFINPELMQWMSKSKRTLKSPDVQAIRQHKDHGMRLPLFIKKHNDEGISFYYMGDVLPIEDSFEEELMQTGNKPVSVVKIHLKFKIPVERGLYNYITKPIEKSAD